MDTSQTDIYAMLLAAQAHDLARELGAKLAGLMDSTDWTLGEITAATSLRPDTVAAVLHDFGWTPPVERSGGLQRP